MAWKKIEPVGLRTFVHTGKDTISICPAKKELGKNSHNSKISLTSNTLDVLRLRNGDRFAWFFDEQELRLAIKLDPNGRTSFIPENGENGKSSKKSRMHMPREVAALIRQHWGIGSPDHVHSVEIECSHVDGVIEIKLARSQKEPTK